MENKLNNDFIEAFNLEKEGFTGITPFVDGNLGFSIKKKNTENDYASLMHVFVSSKALNDESIQPKPIITSATYGKETQGGISMRGEKEFNTQFPAACRAGILVGKCENPRFSHILSAWRNQLTTQHTMLTTT